MRLRRFFITAVIIIISSFAVFADTSVSVTSSDFEIERGSSVEFNVSIQTDDNQKACSIELNFDKSVFEIESYEWLVSGTVDFNTVSLRGVCGCTSKIESGDLFKFVLKSKTSAPIDANFTVSASVKLGSETQNPSVGSYNIFIRCNHQYGVWVVKKNSTCTDSGTQYRTCSVCSAVQTAEIKPKGHTFSDWTVTLQPTCTDEGIKTRTCASCQAKENASIEALGHLISSGNTISESTCSEHGKMVGICERCGLETELELPFTEHDFGEWKDIQSATCTTRGVREHICTICGFKETQNSLPLNHDYEGGVVVREASIFSVGLFEGICKRCGAPGTVIYPCSFTDKDTGVYFETADGVFAENTEIIVKKSIPSLAELSSSESKSKKQLHEVDYEISALLGNESIQPISSVKIVFPIPEEFSRNVALYYIDEIGNSSEIPMMIDLENRTITANVSRLCKYRISDLSYVEPPVEYTGIWYYIYNFGHYIAEGFLCLLLIIFMIANGVKRRKIKKYKVDFSDQNTSDVSDDSVQFDSRNNGEWKNVDVRKTDIKISEETQPISPEPEKVDIQKEVTLAEKLEALFSEDK